MAQEGEDDRRSEQLTELARRVYRAEHDRFVDERDRLGRELKERGDRELAREVGRLRKPTLPAWAVDQLVLREGSGMERLFRLGDAAREALEDERRPVREVVTELHEVIGQLRARAGGYLDDIGAAREPHLDDVERTLTSAAVDPAARQQVATGMLTRPLPASGFGALAGLQPAAADRDEPGGASERRRLRREQQRLERRLDDQRQGYEEAQRRADALQERADEARSQAGAREQEVSETEQRLHDLSARLRAD